MEANISNKHFSRLHITSMRSFRPLAQLVISDHGPENMASAGGNLVNATPCTEIKTTQDVIDEACEQLSLTSTNLAPEGVFFSFDVRRICTLYCHRCANISALRFTATSAADCPNGHTQCQDALIQRQDVTASTRNVQNSSLNGGQPCEGPEQMIQECNSTKVGFDYYYKLS
ncbi:PREDICTED: uncharacterized protein LOC106810317 [Priapulus caudatus]|uniref:Uncharacterized protein LOC106810317 n=1 Tax=Priapulus caudatus TaxID=37621 RepID=A0ABM1EA90_PRICU|nr:PREDICTED: uncharacterized protein LOC106810317 [Priapulus caudatus]